jgi:hypothetical protein
MSALRAIMLAGVACVGCGSPKPPSAPVVAAEIDAAPTSQASATPCDTPSDCYDVRMHEAKAAWQAKQFSEAVVKIDEALLIKPGDAQAITLGGHAACALGNHDKALEFYDQMPPKRRGPLYEFCTEQGVDLPPPPAPSSSPSGPSVAPPAPPVPPPPADFLPPEMVPPELRPPLHEEPPAPRPGTAKVE